MQTRKLSYLAIDRLGELLGLTADALSPIYDLRSAILQLKEAMPPELKEGLDAQLLAEGSLTEQAEGLQPTDSMKLLLTALYCPKKCYRVQMQEKDGTGDTYLLLVDGAWLRIDAFRGELTVSGPFDLAAAELYLRACIETALREPDIQLQIERREKGGVHGAVIEMDSNGYSFAGTVFTPTDSFPQMFVHVFAATDENRQWIAEMLIGKREFVLPESEQEEAPAEKRSYKKALKGFLIALAVNVCAAIIIAVLKAVL